jgi:hypothetical protein
VGLAAFFIIAGIYVFSNSMLYGITLSKKILAEDEGTAMQWVKENTPQESVFVVISGDQNAFCDPITEWFPALTERASITTIQGTEWLLKDGFGKNMFQSHRVQACIDEGVDCFKRESEALEKPFDYVYISISPATKNCGLADTSSLATRGLILDLEKSNEYTGIYHSKDVVIFEKVK